MEETINYNVESYMAMVNKHSKLLRDVELKEIEIISITERLPDISEQYQSDERIKAVQKRKLLRQEIADIKHKARYSKGIMKWMLKEREYEPI